ncbi:hypothetical protein [Tychonema sp. LEGE 06208]|uniref:hypothetical protein n=1 Tax=Tychonema sp. LEGE 06208 TaxID=1828663 RepID=UPI00187E87F5|nr:hypothetical protein [Tychonema sp. LEGE 06208]MBE9161463.1 hypothetical protein [Tychonema sp. LEGE 06208]
MFVSVFARSHLGIAQPENPPDISTPTGLSECQNPQNHAPIPPIPSCTACNKSSPSTAKFVSGNSSGISVIKARCGFCSRFLSCGINPLNSGALRIAGISGSAGKIV